MSFIETVGGQQELRGRDEVQRRLGGGFWDDLRDDAFLVGLFPAPRAEAPSVSRLQDREVVAARPREVEELLRDLRADEMVAGVCGGRSAKAIPLEAGEGSPRARLQGLTEHVSLLHLALAHFLGGRTSRRERGVRRPTLRAS